MLMRRPQLQTSSPTTPRPLLAGLCAVGVATSLVVGFRMSDSPTPLAAASGSANTAAAARRSAPGVSSPSGVAGGSSLLGAGASSDFGGGAVASPGETVADSSGGAVGSLPTGASPSPSSTPGSPQAPPKAGTGLPPAPAVKLPAYPEQFRAALAVAGPLTLYPCQALYLSALAAGIGTGAVPAVAPQVPIDLSNVPGYVALTSVGCGYLPTIDPYLGCSIDKQLSDQFNKALQGLPNAGSYFGLIEIPTPTPASTTLSTLRQALSLLGAGRSLDPVAASMGCSLPGR